ncbi:helix-turn-helix transcriptional regulator [Ileibacterium valens]|uniref:helix-turn-helix domain-containing protein n=1 Tax=Ileibacterium valens TaxID=1862668 RepID=UPI0035154180
MSYTSFGEFMRILRIKHHEVMGDTAKLLDVKSSFLSAVENGKKNVPAQWFDKIVSHYGLSKDERVELAEAIEESKNQFKVNAVHAGMIQRRAALQFARSFDDLDDETALHIIELLSKKGGNQ